MPMRAALAAPADAADEETHKHHADPNAKQDLAPERPVEELLVGLLGEQGVSIRDLGEAADEAGRYADVGDRDRQRTTR